MSTETLLRIRDPIDDGQPTLSIGLTRRKVLGLLSGCLLFAHALARAGEPSRTWRVGVLSSRPRPASIEADFISGFVPALRPLGFVEGRNLRLEWRFSGGSVDKLPQLAQELVDLKVDVIVSGGGPATVAAMKATRSIPIVFAGVGDPVGLGIVSNLRRPGGNVTGVSNLAGDVSRKNLEFLRALLPKLVRVAILLNPGSPLSAIVLRQTLESAKAMGIEVMSLAAEDLSEIEDAFGAMSKARVPALIVGPDPTYVSHAKAVSELAAKYRIPSIYSFNVFPDNGGLMSYGQDLAENYRSVAHYLVKIFNGALPGDLPVEQPARLSLVINDKAARALGLTIPSMLRVIAERIIE